MQQNFQTIRFWSNFEQLIHTKNCVLHNYVFLGCGRNRLSHPDCLWSEVCQPCVSLQNNADCSRYVKWDSGSKAFSDKNSRICILNTPTFYVLRMNFRSWFFFWGLSPPRHPRWKRLFHLGCLGVKGFAPGDQSPIMGEIGRNPWALLSDSFTRGFP